MLVLNFLLFNEDHCQSDERGIAVSPVRNAYIALKTTETDDQTGKSGCISGNPSLKFFPGQQY